MKDYIKLQETEALTFAFFNLRRGYRIMNTSGLLSMISVLFFASQAAYLASAAMVVVSVWCAWSVFHRKETLDALYDELAIRMENLDGS